MYIFFSIKGQVGGGTLCLLPVSNLHVKNANDNSLAQTAVRENIDSWQLFLLLGRHTGAVSALPTTHQAIEQDLVSTFKLFNFSRSRQGLTLQPVLPASDSTCSVH